MRAFFVWSEAGERERGFGYWAVFGWRGSARKWSRKVAGKSVRLKRLDGTRQKRKLRGMRAACVRAEAEGDGDQIKILD